MGKLRKPVAYLCALLLSWMSVVSGVVPVSAQIHTHAEVSDPQARVAVPSMHTHHQSSPIGDAEPRAATGSSDHQQACIETCLSTIAAKLVPTLTAAQKPQPLKIKIDWPRPSLYGLTAGVFRAANWPTGPPGDNHRLGSGTERLVALNARLRN
ncbi:MAG: hypothetical protein KJ587_17235 [Alphaproteobacteria bacterium]|nr:hypothetical protein [Alphaproteobacteria bacterium]